MIMWLSQSQTVIRLLLILCAISYNPGIWGLKVQCNETDQQQLLSFKQEIIDSSGILSSWSKKRDCCGWAGVECDHFTHRVTKLSLPCHDIQDATDCLAGEFSLCNLLELEFLEYLDLTDNNLLFTPPRSCGNYSSKLSYLDLAFNHPELEVGDFTWLVHAYSLKYLNLGGIGLHNSLWLQSLSMLPSLLVLGLKSCQLHDINPSLEFVNFTSLQVLDLSSNYFQSDKLPKWLFNLSNVLDIDLSQNYFHGRLPKTMLNLQKLKSFRIYENKLDGSIPSWLGQYENIQVLDLSTNFFVGPIPETLGNLSSLIELSLFYNNLNGSLPRSLGQLSNLETLDIKATFLEGVVSEKNLSQLSNLRYLYMGSPALSFHFDPHWVPSFRLVEICLTHVHPQLPAWLYTQKSLQGLGIINSSLSSENQDKFWKFVAEVGFLKFVNFSINGDMSNVLLNSRVTWLLENDLRGGLPRISPNVTVFIAVDNSLSGTLSPFLCQKMEEKSNLSYLHIGESGLSGGLTDCWMNWKSLVHISLDNSKLTGKIPESMSSLSNLKSLHLNNNNLFGHIPPSLQNLKKLSIVNLDGNMFSGDVPYWISKSVKVLLLRSNQFRGNIPPQLCQFSSLLVLDVANNRLSGTVPNCLHNITAMVSHNTSNTYSGFIINVFGSEVKFVYTFPLHIKGNQFEYWSRQELIMRIIDLSHNNLIGTIPMELFTLATLQSLDLSNNQLTGRIPEEVGNLKQLECLDLSSNQIDGEIPQSMSELSFLGFLNLSFNNFIGQIPPMAQFQRFDALSYIGNPKLCGAPLTNSCTPEEKSNTTESVEEYQDENEFLSWFYIGMGVGFATSFWGVCASLFFYRKWRHAYFRFLDEMTNQLSTLVILKWNSFR